MSPRPVAHDPSVCEDADTSPGEAGEENEERANQQPRPS